MKLLWIFIISAILMFGCIGSQSGGANEAPPAAMKTAVDYSGQAVVKQGSISIKVPEGTLEQKFQDLKTKLKAESAEIGDVSYDELGDRKQYTVTIKVPPSRFDEIQSMLKEIGEVKGLSVQLEDVTQQYTELDTRIQNRQLELARLQSLYNQSQNVSDLLNVERELTRVETDLEVLQQQKQYLVSRVEMSTIDITVYEEKPATTQLSLSIEGLGAAFFSALAAAITLLVLAAGFLIPIGIVVGILWFIYKSLSGEKKTKPRPPEHARIPPPQ